MRMARISFRLDHVTVIKKNAKLMRMTASWRRGGSVRDAAASVPGRVQRVRGEGGGRGHIGRPGAAAKQVAEELEHVVRTPFPRREAR